MKHHQVLKSAYSEGNTMYMAFFSEFDNHLVIIRDLDNLELFDLFGQK